MRRVIGPPLDRGRGRIADGEVPGVDAGIIDGDRGVVCREIGPIVAAVRAAPRIGSDGVPVGVRDIPGCRPVAAVPKHKSLGVPAPGLAEQQTHGDDKKAHRTVHDRFPKE